MIEQRISELTAAILALTAVIHAQGSAAPKAETPASEPASTEGGPTTEALKAQADKGAKDAEAAKAKSEAAAKAKADKDAKAKADKDASAAAEAKAKSDEEAAAKAASATLPDLTSEIQKILQPILKQKKLVAAKEILTTVGGGAANFASIPREFHAAVLEALQALEVS